MNMSTTARRAIILGSTGAIGGATAQRLAEHGWSVEVTGRDKDGLPQELTDAGVRFHAIDRADTPALSRLIGDGADLVVDLLAFTGADIDALLPALANSSCVVVASSRAVYVDSEGRHINGDAPPRFRVPIAETTETVAPAVEGTDPFTRSGYAPSKVAVELAAAKSGLPITILRPSKVHGRWARNARTRSTVERMLAGADVIEVADRGESVDHLTAALNTAALIETVADDPGARILNTADPDLLRASEIIRAIGRTLGWHGRIIELEPDVSGGDHPWRSDHPVVLDTSAAEKLGYRPVGTARELLAAEVEWIAKAL